MIARCRARPPIFPENSSGVGFSFRFRGPGVGARTPPGICQLRFIFAVICKVFALWLYLGLFCSSCWNIGLIWFLQWIRELWFLGRCSFVGGPYCVGWFLQRFWTIMWFNLFFCQRCVISIAWFLQRFLNKTTIGFHQVTVGRSSFWWFVQCISNSR